jgi:hypothetical protein
MLGDNSNELRKEGCVRGFDCAQPALLGVELFDLNLSSLGGVEVWLGEASTALSWLY